MSSGVDIELIGKNILNIVYNGIAYSRQDCTGCFLLIALNSPLTKILYIDLSPLTSLGLLWWFTVAAMLLHHKPILLLLLLLSRFSHVRLCVTP